MFQNFKPEIKLFFVVALIAVTLSVAGILLLRELSPAPAAQTPPPLSPQPQAQVADTSNWQTYRNDEFGFELKYPPMLTFVFSPEESSLSYDWGEQLGDSFRVASRMHFGPSIYDFSVYSNPQNLSLDEFFEKRISRVMEIPVDKRSDIAVGVQTTRGRLFEWGTENKSVLLFKDDIIIEIEGDTGLDGDPKIFEQILSTFRFAPTTPTAN